MMRLNEGGLLESEAGMRQALAECGCSGDTVERCIALIGDGRLDEAAKLLERHRSAVMGSLHEAQRCVDCLDYVLRSVEKGRA